MEKQWMLDENLHAGPEHLDPAYVETYDVKAGMDPTEAVDTLRRHGLGQASTLVDLGGGTGRLAIAAATVCRRAVVVDVSPAMLAVARRNANAAGVTNVEFVHAGFLTYEHADGSADAVCSRNSLHQLPDFWKGVALARIAAMLRPGGVLWLRDLVYTFEPVEAETWIGQWLAAAPKDTARGWTSEELATHVREEYSTYSWLLEPMLERVGFDVVEQSHMQSRTHATYVCIRR